MYTQKYIKYLKKINILGGGDIEKCDDNYTLGFTKIYKDGYQNCGIYEKNTELIKCENMNDGKIIDKENFVNITKKLIEIKKNNSRGLLPIIYSFCTKKNGDSIDYYTKMEKLDGDITDFLFKKLPELIINAKYSEHKAKFNELIEQLLQLPQKEENQNNNDVIALLTQGQNDDSDDDNDNNDVARGLFGGSFGNEFDKFIEDYKLHYNINLDQINKKVTNIIKTLHDNYLVDDDGYIPQNYGYKLIDEKIEENFKYGYSVNGLLNFNILLYKIDFMSLKMEIGKENKIIDFKFNFLENNKNNFLSKYETKE